MGKGLTYPLGKSFTMNSRGVYGNHALWLLVYVRLYVKLITKEHPIYHVMNLRIYILYTIDKMCIIGSYVNVCFRCGVYMFVLTNHSVIRV